MLQINESITGKCYFPRMVGSAFCDASTGERCRRLLDAVGVSLVISCCMGAEPAANTYSECHPLADGNSGTCSVHEAPVFTRVVVRVPHRA
jgi:hypothetical protein